MTRSVFALDVVGYRCNVVLGEGEGGIDTDPCNDGNVEVSNVPVKTLPSILRRIPDWVPREFLSPGLTVMILPECGESRYNSGWILWGYIVTGLQSSGPLQCTIWDPDTERIIVLDHYTVLIQIKHSGRYFWR